MPQERLFYGDLHGHTYRSDGRNSPSAVVDAAVQRGLDFFSITDHDTTAGIAEASERVAQWNDQGIPLVFIPGIEASTTSGDVIALITDPSQAKSFESFQYRKHQTNALDFIREVFERFDALCVLAHPNLPLRFAIKTHEIEELLSQLSSKEQSRVGLEVSNWASLAWPWRTRVQKQLSEKNRQDWNLTEVSGSDYHAIHNIGKALTAVSTPLLSAKSLADAFSERKTLPQYPELSLAHLPQLYFSATEVELRNTMHKTLRLFHR